LQRDRVGRDSRSMSVWQFIRYWRRGLVALLISVLPLLVAGPGSAAGTDSGDTPAWAAPTAMAIRQVNKIGNAEPEPTLFSNTDCYLEGYREVASSTMTSGCFSSVAFGQIDSDTDMTIFNGTDEAVPILPYNTSQILVPWPQALPLLSLQPTATGGAYLNLYKDPLTALQDQRNVLGQLTAKQLTKPPDVAIRGPDGQQLVINAQTLAFSGGGSWLVVEDLSGSFVRINLATLDMTAFAPAFATQGSPGLLKSQVAVSDDGRFVAIANDAADSFRVYDLTTCQASSDASLVPEQCASYDYRPFVKQQIGGFESIRHLRFMNDGVLSFTALSTVTDNNGLYELAPTASIHSLIDYLALGDSYTSGEGAFDYETGTDTGDDVCHLSTHSYPVLLTHDLFSPSGGHSVACSGAVINDVGNTSGSYQGQVRGVADFDQLNQSNPTLLSSVLANFLPGYVAQQRFVSQYQPGVVTVSVGGNDIGFGDILQRCVEPHVSLHPSDDTCFNTYEDRLEVTNLIDRTVPRWTALYNQLQAESPESRIYVVGYPQIIADTGNCGVNVLLSKSELEFAEELIGYLNNAIQQAAGDAGVSYVDISDALVGHRLCEATGSDVAVNGLTAGTDAGPLGSKIFGQESYHPNALGQELMEQAILKQTHNLVAPAAATPPADNGSTSILDAPKSGRTVSTLVPDDTMVAAVIDRGSSPNLSLSGLRDGLAPQTDYTVHLDGSDGPVIGTATSDDSGNVDTAITVPGDSESGGHTVDITGTNQAGEPVDVTEPIYVPVSDTDSDGDGISDANDSCPGAVNSGQDTDHDGIDDICDPLISSTTPPNGDTSSPTPTGSSGNQSPPATTDPLNTVPAPDDSDEALSSDSGDTIATLTADDQTSADVDTTLETDTSTNQGTVAATARVLGAQTVDPARVAKRSFQAPPDGSHRKLVPAWPGLPVIHWLPWIVLPTLLWLLLIAVGLGLQQLLSYRGRGSPA
jgi:lysophospholipase L1-like esterase